jgi:hypothetical protein
MQAMVFKVVETAEQNWRTLKGHALLAEVVTVPRPARYRRRYQYVGHIP